MTQQQTPVWRGRPEEMQHMFWSEYKQVGDIGLVTKFKGKGDGFSPEVFGPFELDGYMYSAAVKTSQKGTTYYDIERRPMAKPGSPAPQPSQREADIAKAHAENMASEKELTHALLAVAGELHGIKELFEIYVRALPNAVKFTPAGATT